MSDAPVVATVVSAAPVQATVVSAVPTAPTVHAFETSAPQPAVVVNVANPPMAATLNQPLYGRQLPQHTFLPDDQQKANYAWLAYASGWMCCCANRIITTMMVSMGCPLICHCAVCFMPCILCMLPVFIYHSLGARKENYPKTQVPANVALATCGCIMCLCCCGFILMFLLMSAVAGADAEAIWRSLCENMGEERVNMPQCQNFSNYSNATTVSRDKIARDFANNSFAVKSFATNSSFVGKAQHFLQVHM
jgi:hypothetical protein